MNFIRKYMAIIIPAAIVAVSILLFIPTLLLGGSTEKQVEESEKTYQRVKRLAGTVPSEQQWQREKQYQDSFEEDAKSIQELAVQTTQRELLSYNIFPEPKETSQQIYTDYARTYQDRIRVMVLDKMNALDAPSETEISNAIAVRTEERNTSLFDADRGRGRVRSDEKEQALIDVICKRRAQAISVYAHPDLFDWYTYWGEYKYAGKEEAVKDCWYSQIAYWIYQDIADTIAAMNSGSESIFTSDVKRLVRVSFTESGLEDRNRQRSTSRRNDRMDKDIPEFVLEMQPDVFGVMPLTGRVNNEHIDVVHFSFEAVVSSKAVMPFIEELCSEKNHNYREGYSRDGQLRTGLKHNQITVLDYDYAPVTKEEENDYYRYGDDAVVSLNLICEYLFVRDGYDSIKPVVIQEELGQAEDTEDDSSGGAGGYGSGRRRNR